MGATTLYFIIKLKFINQSAIFLRTLKLKRTQLAELCSRQIEMCLLNKLNIIPQTQMV